MSNLQMFDTGYCCTVSFSTHQKVLVMSCCLEWIPYLWQSLKKGPFMILRIKVVWDVILCCWVSNLCIWKVFSALQMKMKALSSWETVGGTCPMTRSHIPGDWSCHSLIHCAGAWCLFWQFVLKKLRLHTAKCDWPTYHRCSQQNGTGS
jgi:hypothetical protein